MIRLTVIILGIPCKNTKFGINSHRNDASIFHKWDAMKITLLTHILCFVTDCYTNVTILGQTFTHNKYYRDLWGSVLVLLYPIFSLTWWRHQTETFSALLAICVGNSPVTGDFPSKRPVTRSFDVFFDLCPINDWVNNREAGDLRRSRAHYDVIVMNNNITVDRSYLRFHLPLVPLVMGIGWIFTIDDWL